MYDYSEVIEREAPCSEADPQTESIMSTGVHVYPFRLTFTNEETLPVVQPEPSRYRAVCLENAA